MKWANLKNTKNIRNTYFHPVTSSPQPRKSSSTLTNVDLWQGYNLNSNTITMTMYKNRKLKSILQFLLQLEVKLTPHRPSYP